jgi:23S rRNA pseudouridine1911/1915/1917 synthase
MSGSRPQPANHDIISAAAATARTSFQPIIVEAPFVSRPDYSRRGAEPRPADGASATTLTIPAEHAGSRLDQALAQLLPQHSRSRLKAWIESGDVRVDGATAQPRHKLRGGERVDVTCVPAEPLHDAPEAIPLDIRFEDDALIVLDKPAGLVVHPGSGNRAGTLLNALLHHAPALAALPRAGIVHRLDKDTSGLMVVAKTAAAQNDLVRQIASRAATREYLAVARGDVARGATIDAPIGRHPVQRTTMAVVAHGKPARTHVHVMERFGIATLLRCRLETGRTHQIRVHLAAIGHPLLGDPAYGRHVPHGALAFGRQALHAASLAFAHPLSGKRLQFASDPPDDFRALLATLRAAAKMRVRP